MLSRPNTFHNTLTLFPTLSSESMQKGCRKQLQVEAKCEFPPYKLASNEIARFHPNVPLTRWRIKHHELCLRLSTSNGLRKYMNLR
jgi:hypothetical protein